MSAIEAGRRGRRVLVLERNAQPGRKILISGGGRCNFTNLHTGPENFLSANPHFAKSALARYTPADFIELVRRRRIAYHEKKLGQLFCDGSAREIVEMLLAECRAAGVELQANVSIQEIRRGSNFRIQAGAQSFEAPALVIATGGLSIPKMGATNFGYRVAAQFGLNIEPCRPALVPLTWNESDLRAYGHLAGVSADVIARAGGAAFREKMLFTHRGLSGPAILQASSYWSPGSEIEIDLLPEIETPANPTSSKSFLRRHLPQRLADCRLETSLEKLHAWRVAPLGSEGYEKAEVTAGGVDTSELSSRTMEAKKIPGLYFVGEVVDVTGHLGGYNFQWAWASGYAAGQAL
jgi:predicted Rossmann fold flavoprotein